MRVDGPILQSLASPGRSAGRPEGSTAFPMLGAATSAARGSAAPPMAATALGVLLALQSVPDPRERRRRAVRRGRELLDRLEQLQLGLVAGAVSPSVLDGLRRSLAEDGGEADDHGLRLVLAEIDVRVAVELAKLEPVGVEG